MRVQYSPQGIHLPEIDLWLDAKEPVESCWISHAHSDHAVVGHKNVIATELTLSIRNLRGQTLLFHKPVQWNGASLTAYPAAHIPGSAQLLVEQGGERLLYTGDIKAHAPLCGVPTEFVPCDHLIIESTFGLPIYKFLTAEEAREQIVAFTQECFEDGVTPLFYGYPLGRGQEIVHVLRQAQIPVAVHATIAQYLPYYEAAGFSCDGWQPYTDSLEKGSALVVPSGTRNALEASGRSFRAAYISGWAALSNARLRARVEYLIPYSDHGGFRELVSIVEACKPKRVDVVHGYTEAFARCLKLFGFDAHAVSSGTRETQE